MTDELTKDELNRLEELLEKFTEFVKEDSPGARNSIASLELALEEVSAHNL